MCDLGRLILIASMLGAATWSTQAVAQSTVRESTVRKHR